MKGDVLLIDQMVTSMRDAVLKLETAKNSNQIEDFQKIKLFILNLQKKINDELEKGFE